MRLRYRCQTMLFLFGLFSLLWMGCDGGGTSEERAPQSIGEFISLSSEFSESSELFSRIGLATDLSNPTAGPFTAFVPTNAAFEKINTSSLYGENFATEMIWKVMNYHVINERFPPNGSQGTVFVESREGTQVRLTRTEDGVFVNGEEVEFVADTQNGLVYRLNAIQLRALTLQDQLSIIPEFSRLNTFVEKSMRTTLDLPGPFTLLAPTNAALASYRDDLDGNPKLYQSLLQYHIAQGSFLSAEISDGQSVPTEDVDGATLTFTRSGEDVFVNGVRIESTDRIAANGVIHSIDTPMTSRLTLAELIAFRTDLAVTSSLLDAPASPVVSPLAEESRSLTFLAPAATAYNEVEVATLQGNASLTEELFTYHLLDGGAFSADDLSSGSPTRSTAEGQTVQIDASQDTLQVNRASVVSTDIRATNGILHIVDGVLMETTRGMERIHLTSRYSVLETALNRVGLTATLASGTYTIFAPPNEVFYDALDADDSGTIEENEFPSDAALQDILLYHVVPGTVPSENIDDGDRATTLEGSSLVFGVAATGAITINPSREAAVISPADLNAENGVVHEVDALLLP